MKLRRCRSTGRENNIGPLELKQAVELTLEFARVRLDRVRWGIRRLTGASLKLRDACIGPRWAELMRRLIIRSPPL
jgi:hypothetical protein